MVGSEQRVCCRFTATLIIYQNTQSLSRLFLQRFDKFFQICDQVFPDLRVFDTGFNCRLHNTKLIAHIIALGIIDDTDHPFPLCNDLHGIGQLDLAVCTGRKIIQNIKLLTAKIFSSRGSTANVQYQPICSEGTYLMPATPLPYFSYAAQSSPVAGTSPIKTSSPYSTAKGSLPTKVLAQATAWPRPFVSF